MYQITANRSKFDFEIGYFIKSPCRDCDSRKEFPGCFEECVMLDKVRTVLAESISCFNPHSVT
jgi:hypothetical protein